MLIKKINAAILTINIVHNALVELERFEKIADNPDNAAYYKMLSFYLLKAMNYLYSEDDLVEVDDAKFGGEEVTKP